MSPVPDYSNHRDAMENGDDELDYTDIEARYHVQVPKGFDRIVVVDGVPIVDDAKEQKLLPVIKRVFKDVGNIIEGGIFHPKDAESGKSKGFMFIEFETADQAVQAVRRGNGYALDRTHTLSVNKFDDVETFTEMDQEYKDPETATLKEKEHLKSWLMDARARDQFVLMKAEEVSVLWNNKTEAPDVGWTDYYVQWSPKGTYLTTFHKQGVQLWGGPNWDRINKFAHPNVKLLDFSPSETYMVTWSSEPFMTPEGESHHVIVWDVLSGSRLRSFSVDPTSMQRDGKAEAQASFQNWPMFKWSFDDKYVARATLGPQGMIQIYETPSMVLLDKKSIKIENLMSFGWSPADHLIAYWTPEAGNIPARVTVQRIPSREIVRTKNLFNVLDAKMAWQSSGDYLLVKVDRAKTKKLSFTNFEIFRVKTKEIPVDVVEFKAGEAVGKVFWEPHGDRFVVLSSEGQVSRVYLYEMQSAQPITKPGATPTLSEVVGNAKLIKQVDRKSSINDCVWSPKGRFYVLAAVRTSGDLEFWDADEATMMNSGEHYSMTDTPVWDPTGRYVISSVSWWRVQSDTGYTIWSFIGNKLHTAVVPVFKQISWRPRPVTLLTKDDQKRIRKSIKEYSKEFEEADAATTSKASQEVVERRLSLWKEWRDYRARCEDDYKKERRARTEVYGFDPDSVEQDEGDFDETVEEVIEEVEEDGWN
ncbi:hypothetical protein SmJEL517_g00364 [Synchytrium microbalum]|uniref:Eukaryotic translation initiation factor 3 subunit B n=1 Tax=Synchytrium microbalum TaxID=1806994 RepID=A0A507CFS0_9FUNG|nr:uncharacterized protein SmJEL517_g00364 [Synchytrium microbalum]TPX38208.1 hypothetical protein SmJEL517_g00364 [Synchytrium microbalum]